MSIIVLGMNGMLGRYVYNYLSDFHKVIGTTRKALDVSIISPIHHHHVKQQMANNLKSGDVVVNCVGIIKQRSGIKKLEFVGVNSLFPLFLQEACYERDAKLIHVTTDCVYDGLEGGYNEDHDHTATDVYGMSKSLGEPEEATVIRTSIIGEEKGQARSLVEWIKSNRDSTVNGYTNHFWNGITCLQFAKVCRYIIENKLFWKGVKHITSPTTVNKFELVNMISDIYDLNITVTPFETPEKCDRSMSSVRDDIEISVPELEVQIREMKDFKRM